MYVWQIDNDQHKMTLINPIKAIYQVYSRVLHQYQPLFVLT